LRLRGVVLRRGRLRGGLRGRLLLRVVLLLLRRRVHRATPGRVVVLIRRRGQLRVALLLLRVVRRRGEWGDAWDSAGLNTLAHFWRLKVAVVQNAEIFWREIVSLRVLRSFGSEVSTKQRRERQEASDGGKKRFEYKTKMETQEGVNPKIHKDALYQIVTMILEEDFVLKLVLTCSKNGESKL
jgi:hypothetical protein